MYGSDTNNQNSMCNSYMQGRSYMDIDSTDFGTYSLYKTKKKKDK